MVGDILGSWGKVGPCCGKVGIAVEKWGASGAKATLQMSLHEKNSVTPYKRPSAENPNHRLLSLIHA